jgi:hypothetical protein
VRICRCSGSDINPSHALSKSNPSTFLLCINETASEREQQKNDYFERNIPLLALRVPCLRNYGRGAIFVFVPMELYKEETCGMF